MSAKLIPFPVAAPEPNSRQLADRLLLWHADLAAEITRNDWGAEDHARAATSQLECSQRCAAEASVWINRDVENYLALMCCAARYALTARIYRARAKELRS